MHNLGRGFLAAKALIYLLTLIGAHQSSWAQGQPITFSVTGDVPYSASEATVFQQQIPNHNKYSPSAFFVHVGDIASSGQCAESNYSMIASMLKGLTVPAYVVTGDNEITDCNSPTQAFSLWMKYFKNFEKNFCGAPPTERQSVHPANFAFTMKGVLFIGIDLAGGPSPVQKDVDWIKQQLQAKGSGVRAAVIFAHFPPNTSTTFSTPFRQAAAAFGKPVLFLHGHGHAWGMSNPFPEPNILRVQVNKGASEDPVQVTVTMNTSSPSTAFTFKRKPWSLQTIVNMPPCANAGPDQTLASNATSATLKGQAVDDGDPNGALTTIWSKMSGPGTVTLGNARSLTTTASFNVPGTYILRLTANDTQLQGSDEVKIIVQGAIGPVLSINDVTLNEGNAGTLNAIFTVSLAFSNGSTVTVDYQIVDGTAVNGEDYIIQPNSGTLTFSNWTKKHIISIPINGDNIDEPGNEKFFVNLMNVTNAAFADSQGIGTIVNDDAPIPPKTPDHLLATTTGASTVDISWRDQSNNENGFRLERQTGTGAFATIVTLAPNVNFYSDTGLAPGTVYSYRVYAFNPFGLSAYSNIYSTETASEVVHDPNTNLALNDSTNASSTYVGYPAANVVDGDTQDSHWRSGSASPVSVVWLGVDLGSVQVVGRAAIIWKADYHANNYELKVSNNNVNWKTVYKTTNGGGGNEEFLFIPILARYVRLYMTAGVKGSYRISELELYSGELNTPPQAPTNLTATATSNSTISISWKHTSNEEYGFEIERAINGGSFKYIATVGRNVSFYNDGGLNRNTTYDYRVRAYNFVDDSDYSNVASATTLDGNSGPPNPSINLALHKLLTASSLDTTKPALFAADGNATTYWSSTSGMNVWLRVDLGTAQAVGRAIVRWQDVYYAKAYEIQVSNDASSWTTVYSATSGSSGVQNLIFAQTLARYVQIYMTLGNRGSYRILELEIYSGATNSTSKRSDEAAATTVIPNEFELQQNYPNPFSASGIFDNPSTQIRFGLPQASHVTIKVYTINGVEVRTLVDAEYPAGTYTITFHAENLPSGTYFYVMRAGEARKVRRLVLVK